MHKTETASRYWLYVVQVVILAVVYFGAAKLGLSLASVKGIVTLVWPPTGIALAALLLFGYRLWPGVALGAFWVNIEAGASVAAVGISAGNTLEAVAGAYLLHRCVGFRNSLERLRDVLGLVGLAAVVSTMISATMGAASLGLSGVIPWTAFGSTWWVWWLGDVLGALLVAPVLLTWGTNFHVDRQLPRLLEAITLLVSLVIVSQIVFSGWLASYVVTTAPLPFTVFPFLVWAALRFGQRGAVTTTLIGTGIAVWGTAHGVGPFVLETVHLSLIFLSSFTSAAAVTAMLLAAAISERKRVEEVLRDQGERYRIITELMSDYAFAYRVEPDGTFIEEWATVDSLKRITGFAPEEIGTTFILYHPEEQERANCDVKAVIEGKPSDGEYRIITKSGELRWMHISRRPICDSQQARVVRFYGIAKDITERKQSEEALRRSEEKYRLVVESSLQGVNIFQNRRIVFVNPAVCQIMGYSAAELTSFSPEQILATVHPEDRALAMERNHARLQGQPVSPHYEYRIVRRDGAVRWLETSTTPILYEGEPGLLSISLDITERKQAEAALRESEARYRSLFEDAPISLWEEDFSAVKAYMDRLQSQGVADFGAYFESHPEVVTCCLTMIKIIDVNKSTLELYQATSKEEFFGDLTQFFDQRSYEVFKEELIAIAQGNTKVEFETVNYTLKGNRKEIILTWFVCPGYEETFSKVLVSIIDVTERKLLEEQLRQAQKMEAIGRLAGGVAHDFNNILTVIKGYAALLLQNLDVHDPLSKDIGQIQKSAERAAALTHQLLAFSRKQVLQPIVLDFNAIVTNMNEMLRRLIGED
ncbi:MAG TPA: MASE1 domain-containing protein, partial [Anaerolineae bacterium]|nr:MASE1 domain-containing protein [Anaerolineae bacterium]